MLPEDQACIRATARIAYRLFDSLPETEQREVLKCIILAGTPEETAAADKHLYCLDQTRDAQMTLKQILDGGNAA